MSGWSVLGIDNGLTGAIAIYQIASNSWAVADTPTRVGKLSERLHARDEDSEASDIDVNAVFHLLASAVKLSSGACVAIIEQPLSSFNRVGKAGLSSSAKAIQSLIRTLAIWEVACERNGIALYQIPPQTWKRQSGLTGLSKEQSIRAVADRFGIVVKRHDQADAVLLADYLVNRPDMAFLKDVE